MMALLHDLRELEVALHQPNVRRDRARLDELLHEDFEEFGRSGQTYTKADVLKQLPEELSTAVVWSQDFKLSVLTETLALLTYKSAHADANGGLSRHALRSSVWQKTKHGWQMRFHQGTPTEEFARSRA